MNNLDDLDAYVDESMQTKTLLLNGTDTKNSIKISAKLALSTLQSGGKLIFAGNG